MLMLMINKNLLRTTLLIGQQRNRLRLILFRKSLIFHDWKIHSSTKLYWLCDVIFERKIQDDGKFYAKNRKILMTEEVWTLYASSRVIRDEFIDHE